MRAHQVMNRQVVTVTPETSVVDAADIMLRQRISGLPVVDGTGRLVGVVSEGDFIRRAAIGTEKERGRWLALLTGADDADTARAHGRTVGEIMTATPLTIVEDTPLAEVAHMMEAHGIKRLPVLHGDRLVGIVTRSDLLQAVARLARTASTPATGDERIRERVIRAMQANEWLPFGLEAIVRDGVVHLSGIISDERCRQAALAAAEAIDGVRAVHDHLCWVDPTSGMYLNSPEDDVVAKAH
jgi:CBS domain-containing protein